MLCVHTSLLAPRISALHSLQLLEPQGYSLGLPRNLYTFLRFYNSFFGIKPSFQAVSAYTVDDPLKRMFCDRREVQILTKSVATTELWLGLRTAEHL